MEVRIIKSNKHTYWYADKIGEIITVNVYDSKRYCVPIIPGTNGGGCIDIDDCEIVEETDNDSYIGHVIDHLIAEIDTELECRAEIIRKAEQELATMKEEYNIQITKLSLFNLQTMYTVDYFIDFFSKIPENKWCTRQITNHLGQHCALGHCQYLGIYNVLIDIASGHNISISSVNDGLDRNYPQPTPKQRILAALHDIKNKQQ